MKLILASNVLEHPGFVEFVRDVSLKHSGAIFAVTGDLLNVFPEPGENIKGSISYELFGEVIDEELKELVNTHFREAKTSPLVPLLKDMFYPLGQDYARAKAIARLRYRHLFQKMESALRFKAGSSPAFLYIPGNMDYPLEAAAELSKIESIRQIDMEVLDFGAVKLGAIGGIPNKAHAFRGIVEISPYEMDEREYERRLAMLWGVDILMTHLSPSESEPLDRFLAESPVQLIISRAPFDFRRSGDFRGQLEVVPRHNKSVIMVRPFDYPQNAYFVVDLSQGCANPIVIQQYLWTSEQQHESGLFSADLFG